MAGIMNEALAGSTVTYNGVQFGGIDASYPSTPPEYTVEGTMVYDDANRAVIGVDYTLVVKTVFAAANEGAMSTNAEAVRERLSAPAKELKIQGIGIGFGTISRDPNFGPKPISFKWQPYGESTWECVWVVQFRVIECLSGAAEQLAWHAFNFETTWQNDFEGQCTRTISGYVEVDARPGEVSADRARDRIKIEVPNGFRRINNVWNESADKRRLSFVVVDEQLGGTPYPAGVTLAQGRTSFSSTKRGFAEGEVGISMTLRTSPKVPPSTAGLIFVQAVLAKQQALTQRLAPKGNAIPTSISIANNKYDDARTTECSATWHVTRCLSAMMTAAGIWEPLTPGNYQQWRTSIEGLWDNRGNARLESSLSDDIVLDACDNVTTRTIGVTSARTEFLDRAAQFQFGCPEIPADGGWLGHKVRVTVVREDNHTMHRKAISYTIESQSAPSTPTGEPVPLGGTPYNNYTTVEIGAPLSSAVDPAHVLEAHGQPEVMVLLQFKGLRVKHKPVCPVITTIGGLPAFQVKAGEMVPTVEFDIFQCPVYYLNTWRLYRVNGYVREVKPQGGPMSCAKGEYSSDI